MEKIISKNIRIRAELRVGDGSIIDDYCYFSANVHIGRLSHIASGCSVLGGKKFRFTLGDMCSLSSGVRIFCSSNDFVNDLVIINLSIDIGDSPIQGNVNIGDYCGVGANSVIMPGNDIPEGVCIGALSYVPPGFKFEPWTIYAGIPIEKINKRNKENVEMQIKKAMKILSIKSKDEK